MSKTIFWNEEYLLKFIFWLGSCFSLTKKIGYIHWSSLKLLLSSCFVIFKWCFLSKFLRFGKHLTLRCVQIFSFNFRKKLSHLCKFRIGKRKRCSFINIVFVFYAETLSAKPSCRTEYSPTPALKFIVLGTASRIFDIE